MPKILWIVDGVGWGYDNLSKAIEKELPNYSHVMIAKKCLRVMYNNGKTGFVCEKDSEFQKRLDEIDADIILSMNPMNKRFLKGKRAIVRISGMRALKGWRR